MLGYHELCHIDIKQHVCFIRVFVKSIVETTVPWP